MDLSYFERSRSVKELSPKDFDSTQPWILKSKKCSVVMFYAPWCGFCKSAKDDYEKAAGQAPFIECMALNCEKYSEHLGKIRTDMQGLVPSYPTFIHYQDGEPQWAYTGKRGPGDFVKAFMCMHEGKCEGVTQRNLG